MTRQDVIVIGAGQAGLATGRELQKVGLDFVILEAGTSPVGSWPKYYDSLQLFSPARYSTLGDFSFPGLPGDYPTRDAVVAYLKSFAREFALPILTERRVTAVERLATGGFSITTDTGETFEAAAVVVATGTFGAPYIPDFKDRDRYRGTFLHSAGYREPKQFMDQRVVVVGAANSAVQIAVELAQYANVTIAARKPVRYVPKRLLGKDIHFWFRVSGIDSTNWLSDQGTPVLDDGQYRQAIDRGRPFLRQVFRAFTEHGVIWPDGTPERVDVVISATGFRPDVPFLNGLSALDRFGLLNQKGGKARQVSGLYFVGYPGLRSFASGTLRGVGRDAAVVVDQIHRAVKATGR